MEEVIRKLEKRIDHLEYEDMKQLKDSNHNFQLQLEKNIILTEQTTNVCNKLSETMDSVRDTMVQITESIKDSNKISSELTKTVGQVNDKVDKLKDNVDMKFDEVDEKINAVDNKTKIDVATEQTSKAKDALSKVFTYGGSIGFIVMLIIEILNKT